MSQYPVLDNKPIDQWKVTELKDELRRRKLKANGLKDDLIKRLDEAIRVERELALEKEREENLEKEREENLEKEREENLEKERENAVKNVDNGLDLEALPVVEVKSPEPVPLSGTVENVGDKDDKLEDAKVLPDINDSVDANVEEGIKQSGISTSVGEEKVTIGATSVEIKTTVITESVVSDAGLSEESAYGNSKTQLDNEDSKAQLDTEDTKTRQVNEGLKSPLQDVMLDSSASNKQVSEVNPNLGFQVKSDSISTDSVSINEKIELKDNIIDDNVKLELDVKQEMAAPSSGNVVAVSGESHPMDVEEPEEKKASVEEKGDNNAVDADLNWKNDSLDLGDSEKLNLDRSSGDESMEEDLMETKNVDSNYNPDEVSDRNEKREKDALKEESFVHVVGKDLSANANKKDIHSETKIHPAAPTEKRKLIDQEAAESAEPVKRQRRWKSENIKVPELQSSNRTTTTTPKDAFKPTLLKRSFSRSDSTASEDTPKERVVPPSQKTPTDSLRIDRFLRPFTLKAVQELLGKTGSVASFWMDQIKTHCYVTYSSVEEAVATRNAVYNLQWPPNGGRLLEAEFVDPQEVKMKLEAPPQTPTTPVTPVAGAPAPSSQQPQPSPRQQVSKQQQLPPPPPLPLPPPPPVSNPPSMKERLGHPTPSERHDPPLLTLDDLFRKTKATPRIYYLPLTEDQVAAKLGERGKNSKQ